MYASKVGWCVTGLVLPVDSLERKIATFSFEVSKDFLWFFSPLLPNIQLGKMYHFVVSFVFLVDNERAGIFEDVSERGILTAQHNDTLVILSKFKTKGSSCPYYIWMVEFSIICLLHQILARKYSWWMREKRRSWEKCLKHFRVINLTFSSFLPIDIFYQE